jgi:hypothetical protein
MVLKFLLTFSAGIYCGIFLAQNYNIPKVYEPKELIKKTQEFIGDMNEKYKKERNGENDDKKD